MKIAVTATGPSLDAEVDPRFGRCAYFVIVETDDMSFEAVENENVALGGGAGIQSAQLVAGRGAKTVLTGNCGPKAFQSLSAASVQIMVGVSGTVRDAVEKFKAGALDTAPQPSVPSHFGMGGGRGMGRGIGARGMAPRTGPPTETNKEQSLSTLREEARTLKEQMNEIDRRIAQMQNGEQ